MTRWLASVQSTEEARSLLAVLPDILDVKDPSQGALGALSVQQVSEIVTLVEGQCLISATVGDLPMQSHIIAPALKEMATSGVNYIKVGLSVEPELTACLIELEATLETLITPVIAVLFADQMPDQDYLPLIKKVGFAGVMIDTAKKNGKQLLDYNNQQQLSTFVQAAKRYELLCGLAGALRHEDIAALKPLGADYLGFRSALCQQHNRSADIDVALAKKIDTAIHKYQ